MTDISQDPTYLAYQRALGFQQQQAGEEAALATEKAQMQLQTQVPEVQFQGGLERRGIEAGYEDRGLLRSSMPVRDIGNQQHEENYKIGQLQSGAATDIGDIQRQMADQQASAARQLGDQALTADARQYLQAGLAPYRHTPYVRPDGSIM